MWKNDVFAEGASRAMKKYNRELAEALGVPNPTGGNPSDGKIELLHIVRIRYPR